MSIHDSDFHRLTAGFTGTIASTFRRHGRKHIVVFGRGSKRKPQVLTIRLGATHNPSHFKIGRKIRVTEIVGKMGRELLLAFPAGKRIRA